MIPQCAVSFPDAPVKPRIPLMIRIYPVEVSGSNPFVPTMFSITYNLLRNRNGRGSRRVR
jgi:hypothetical protein